jgi:hypothetical protein
MSFASNHVSIHLCDPKLPHDQEQYCSMLPHRACSVKRQYSSAQAHGMITLAENNFKASLESSNSKSTGYRTPTRSSSLQQHGGNQHVAFAKGPLPRSTALPMPRYNRPRISPLPLQPGISMRQMTKPRVDSFTRSTFAKKYPDELSAVAGAEWTNISLQGGPAVGYYAQHARPIHNRNFSAPEQRRLASREPTTPLGPARPRATTSTSSRQPSRISPPAPNMQRSPPSGRLHSSRPPCSMPLTLFPPASPTNSLETARSIRTVSSPASLRPSLLLAPRVSVFDGDDDDDGNLGLLEYLKWPLQGSRGDVRRKSHNAMVTRTAVSTWNWKWVMCC